MTDPVTIVSVKQDGVDGVLVSFSDGTIAGYVVEELFHLRPVRELDSPATHKKASLALGETNS